MKKRNLLLLLLNFQLLQAGKLTLDAIEANKKAVEEYLYLVLNNQEFEWPYKKRLRDSIEHYNVLIPFSKDSITVFSPPLIVAILKHKAELFRMIVHHSETNPNLADSEGYTPLIHALHLQNRQIDSTTNVMNILLSHPKIDVNKSDADGITPLMHAAYKNNFYLFERLFNRGADINAKTETGETVEEYARLHSDTITQFFFSTDFETEHQTTPTSTSHIHFDPNHTVLYIPPDIITYLEQGNFENPHFPPVYANELHNHYTEEQTDEQNSDDESHV